jgi:penicillin-insensitive murein DD-endopeptidase
LVMRFNVVVASRRFGGVREVRVGRRALLALACACACAGWLHGPARGDARVEPVTTVVTPSVSTGLPWDGTLERGVQLFETALVRAVPGFAKRGNFYGTSELVRMLERSARVIAGLWPGSQLAVGELSAARGGKLDGHHSHRSGRDVDVAFFMRDAAGQSTQFHRFVSFGIDGVARRVQRRLYFDDARNWALVATLLRDPEARVQYIFVAQSLRTRLLMEGRRRGESDAFLRVAAAVLVQPKEGHRHDTHFHLRIYCAPDDRPACQDTDPYWPWYDGVPREGQFAELPIIRWTLPRASSESARAIERAVL